MRNNIRALPVVAKTPAANDPGIRALFEMLPPIDSEFPADVRAAWFTIMKWRFKIIYREPAEVDLSHDYVW